MNERHYPDHEMWEADGPTLADVLCADCHQDDCVCRDPERDEDTAQREAEDRLIERINMR